MSQYRIAAHFQSSLTAMTEAACSDPLLQTAHDIAWATIRALQGGGKLLLAGNGGSAADAQHLAAEIVGRYKIDRPGWAAIALTTDTSALTAISNDYGYEQVFARQVQGLGRRGDIFWGFSTSGKSPNIVAALKMARELGLVTVGFVGAKGDINDQPMTAHCDLLFVSPTDDTPVIQQLHMVAGHAICDEIEHALTTAPKA
ncbi:D-sedoheptulose 7-phosphate isomerase [Bradyrhizobium prioriisuperbiae]|uniref:D-sedoheptulose 7-phosphate isomerase n=1 Tax=Bradyrhizobium prioriisuperbiae TaxID=2854389 RepID=UPI0028E46CC3|nr:D-sedoheptulose 7-phosphate isomerase [Bradyrhizobium prioritasuperba]